MARLSSSESEEHRQRAERERIRYECGREECAEMSRIGCRHELRPSALFYGFLYSSGVVWCRLKAERKPSKTSRPRRAAQVERRLTNKREEGDKERELYVRLPRWFCGVCG